MICELGGIEPAGSPQSHHPPVEAAYQPAPGTACTSLAAVVAWVAASTATARGCSLRASRAAATANTSSRVAPFVVATSMTTGRLAVNVPVLSRATARMVPRVSSARRP